MSCTRCDSIPGAPKGAGDLFLWFPVEHVTAKVLAALTAVQTETQDGALRVRIPDEGPAKTIGAIAAALTRDECRGTRAIFVAGGGAPELKHLGQFSTLLQLDVLTRAEWLLDLLSENRFESWFQPIVEARDTSRIVAHEALLRGRERDGTLVPPGQIFRLAHDAELSFQVDLAARRSAIRSGAAIDPAQHIFVNFSPAAIYDPQTCLRATVAAINEVGISHDRVVFEVIEADRIADPDHLQRILDYYRSQGFRVALDDLGAGWSTLNLVHRLRPDFIKVDQELIRGVHSNPTKAVIAAKLLEMSHELDIRSVVEGIEEPAELQWALDHGADLVQGYLIARPAKQPVTATPRLAATLSDGNVLPGGRAIR